MADVTIRRFLLEEWPLYRAVRLRALATDPGVFSSNHAAENAYPDSRWQETLLSSDLGVFGLFDEGKVIGLTGIAIKRQAVADGSIAGLWGSWIDPVYRGQGLSSLMYQARLDWARAHPDVQIVRVSHRAGNVASRAANQKYGFVFTHEEPHVWPDGMTEGHYYYELRVK